MNYELIKGYKFSGISCGIKKNNKLDLGLIYLEKEGQCVASFTKNLLKSNSIIVSQKHLNKTKNIKCILVNSGCANTACGKDGLKITEEICKNLAKKLNIKKEEVIVASTGVIGKPLPKKKIINNLNNLVSSLYSKDSAILKFAKSIMTTDKKPKVVIKKINLKKIKGTILCVAKGAGMIAPQLELYKPSATMLVFLLTDIKLTKNLMERIMRNVVIPNFNSFSIDGDTSPNDTIFFVSNNAISEELSKKDIDIIEKSIEEVCRETILKLLFDGEGVTKVVKLVIKNLKNKDAEIVARAVSNSLLVKTAIYGADPNWGRILSAVLRSGVKLNPKRIGIWIDKFKVVENGERKFFNEKKIRRVILKNFYEIKIDVKKTKSKKPFIFYTTDLSKKYVDINSKYMT
jgi:glutamate N-acetyltransferase/amino-acid N-acetyltransferase